MNTKFAILKEFRKPFAVMGILNVTPDSFYDGGKYNSIDNALMQAEKLIEDGADIIDIGGVSTRPGAELVDQDEECGRVIPIIDRLVKECNVSISVDTTWTSVAAKALDAGAHWINDISAGRFDPEMSQLIAKRKCPVVLMHSRKTPALMQIEPQYENVTREVIDELWLSTNKFLESGVSSDKIIIDPGIGFAKTADHNVTLLHDLEKITDMGFPVLIGTSRKNFIGKITARSVEERLGGSLATIAQSFRKGAVIFRVHDVKETVDFLKVFSVIEDKLPIDFFNDITG
jgi:dihydropteroate synthase